MTTIDNRYYSAAIAAMKDSCVNNLKMVARVNLGLPMDALADASGTTSVLFIHQTNGQVKMRGLGDDCHIVRATVGWRFYWLLNANNQEDVEYALADTVENVQQEFGLEANRRLTYKDVAETSVRGQFFFAASGTYPISFDVGYEEIAGKSHRALVYPITLEVEL